MSQASVNGEGRALLGPVGGRSRNVVYTVEGGDAEDPAALRRRLNSSIVDQMEEEPKEAMSVGAWIVGLTGLLGAIVAWLAGSVVTRRIETGAHAYTKYVFIVWFGHIWPIIFVPVGWGLIVYKAAWKSYPHPVHGTGHVWASFDEFRDAWGLRWKPLLAKGAWLSLAYMVPDLFWFMSLSLTSVAAATTIYNSSTAFVVLFSIIFLKERASLIKFVAALLAVGSSAMVSLASEIAPQHKSKGDSDSASHPSNPVLGGVFSFAGAVLYGLYEVAYKRWGLVTGESDPIGNVLLIAGFMGVGNTFFLAPLLPICHYTTLETFELPRREIWGDFFFMAFMLAMFITCLMTALALLPSPTYVAVGITLTVPGSLVLDAITQGATYNWPFLLGSAGVILSFTLIVAKEHIRALLEHPWL